MHVWTSLKNFSPFIFSPHHKSIHWSFYMWLAIRIFLLLSNNFGTKHLSWKREENHSFNGVDTYKYNCNVLNISWNKWGTQYSSKTWENSFIKNNSCFGGIRMYIVCRTIRPLCPDHRLNVQKKTGCSKVLIEPESTLKALRFLKT